jgi:phosphatidylglycerophosphate synthase
MQLSMFLYVPEDFTITQSFGGWRFILSALAIFAYGTLDAIDGKQARRTNSCSPLG